MNSIIYKQHENTNRQDLAFDSNSSKKYRNLLVLLAESGFLTLERAELRTLLSIFSTHLSDLGSELYIYVQQRTMSARDLVFY